MIICGLPGTGKTYLSTILAKYLDAVVLSTDKIRKELFCKPNYSTLERRLVYEVVILIAKYLHSVGTRCIIDGTFNKKASRLEVKEKLNLSPDEFFVIQCYCPEEIIKSRLENRKNDYSDAGFSTYLKMKKIFESPGKLYLSIDTSRPIETNILKILQYINKNHPIRNPIC